jgi:hypothetical protein
MQRTFYQTANKGKSDLPPGQIIDPVLRFLQRPTFAAFRRAFPHLLPRGGNQFASMTKRTGNGTGTKSEQELN